MRRITLMLVLSVAAVLAGVACDSSSDSSSDAQPVEPGEPAAEPAPEPTEDAPAADFCTIVREWKGVVGDTGPATGDPAATEDYFRTSSDYLDDAAAVAPAPVAAATTTLRDATSALVIELEAVAFDFSALGSTGQALLTDPAYEAADEEFDAYTEPNCGV